MEAASRLGERGVPAMEALWHRMAFPSILLKLKSEIPPDISHRYQKYPKMTDPPFPNQHFGIFWVSTPVSFRGV